MATAIFTLHNGDVATFDNPHTSKSDLRAKIEGAMSGGNPNLVLLPMSGPTLTLKKTDIKNIEYR